MGLSHRPKPHGGRVAAEATSRLKAIREAKKVRGAVWLEDEFHTRDKSYIRHRMLFWNTDRQLVMDEFLVTLKGTNSYMIIQSSWQNPTKLQVLEPLRWRGVLEHLREQANLRGLR